VSRFAIGLDVGGTSARAGLVSDTGKILFRSSARTGRKADQPALLERFHTGVQAALGAAAGHGHPVAGIGVAMPAFLDEEGRVTGSCNLPGLNGAAVGRIFEDRFHLPVRIENDVSACAYGEYYFGGHLAASRRMLFLAVGTGIGAGMMVDGRLLRLSHGCLGDPGHVIVDPRGQFPCRCGGNGCLEAVASGWALAERAHLPPKEIFERARQGDAALDRLVRQAAGAIGAGLASLCVILTPDTIVLGGGVAEEAGESFRARIDRALRSHAAPLFTQGVRIVAARSGSHAGLLGAAALILFGNDH
jgi:predicted NBD/HSP70 family sugar kinase